MRSRPLKRSLKRTSTRAGGSGWLAAALLWLPLNTSAQQAHPEERAEAAAALEAPPSGIPQSLRVPTGHHIALTLSGKGTQVYRCALAQGQPSWMLTAPAAVLLSGRGQVAGSHYAGPTWEALDGSTVVGAAIASEAIDPTAVPWLLIEAVEHSSNGGSMAKVTYIQRLDTTGGLPPAQGCDRAHLDAIHESPYSATYRFYRASRHPGQRR